MALQGVKFHDDEYVRGTSIEHAEIHHVETAFECSLWNNYAGTRKILCLPVMSGDNSLQSV